MAVVDVDADEVAALYPCKLLLSRPDQYPMILTDRIRGALIRIWGTRALTRGIEQLDFLVAALCGVVRLLEGYDIAAIGYAVRRPHSPKASERAHCPVHQWSFLSIGSS
jgi:hypothetical protein